MSIADVAVMVEGTLYMQYLHWMGAVLSLSEKREPQVERAQGIFKITKNFQQSHFLSM